MGPLADEGRGTAKAPARRRGDRIVAGLAAVLVVAGLTAPEVQAAPAQTTGLEVTVDPATGLTDGTEVTVRVTGLGEMDGVAVWQCPADAVSSGDCDVSDAGWGENDGSGAADATLRVDAVIVGGFEGDREVDCRVADACVVAVADPQSSSDELTARAALHFAPDAPVAPPPTLTATPDHDLVDGQTVRLEGTGFVWTDYALVAQCPADASVWQDCDAGTSAELDGGAFGLDVRASSNLFTANGTVDCRVAGACVLVASSDGRFGTGKTGLAPLHLDPDGPVPPTPTLTVTPSTGLADGTTVTVEGRDWPPGRSVWVQVCETGSPSRCDESGSAFPGSDDAGRWTTELRVTGSFETFDGELVQCRVAPGCAVVAAETESGRSASVPLTFGPPSPSRGRYLDPVFEEVDVTLDVVYRETVTSQGAPIELKMDIYQPAGDIAEQRPAIVWMHGGYFIFGDKSNMANYARAVARRGYVGISLQYRLRPELPCCPTPWDDAFFGAMQDAYDDATAGVQWLKEHAAEYRIDPRAIVAGGYSAGASTSFNLAYLPGQRGPARSEIAAALPISGAGIGQPNPGDPPVLAFHGTIDDVVPWAIIDTTCNQARAVDLRCDLVSYEGEGHEIVGTRFGDIVPRSMDFLAEEVLVPLGYLEGPPPGPEPEPPPAAGGPPGDGGSSTTSPAASARGRDGDLARTGTGSTVVLARAGMALVAAGAIFTWLSRRRRRQARQAEASAGPAASVVS